MTGVHQQQQRAEHMTSRSGRGDIGSQQQKASCSCASLGATLQAMCCEARKEPRWRSSLAFPGGVSDGRSVAKWACWQTLGLLGSIAARVTTGKDWAQNGFEGGLLCIISNLKTLTYLSGQASAKF